MNRALFRLSLACLVMFVLLLLNVNYVQAFEANSLANRPGNIRVFDQQFQYQRGSIIAAGGGQNVKIAVSNLVKGTNIYQRSYPFGPVYAPVTGYDSIFGKTGIEAAEEKDLAGTASNLTVHNLIGLLTGKPKEGATVYTTISAKAQQAARWASSPSTRRRARSWPWRRIRHSTPTSTPRSTGQSSTRSTRSCATTRRSP